MDRPQFDRETYLTWLVTRKYKDADQRSRWQAALNWYDQGTGQRALTFTPGAINSEVSSQAEPKNGVACEDGPSREEQNWPDLVVNYPNIGLAVNNKHQGNGWRAWIMAKSLDPKGSGKIKQSELKDFLDHLGISARQQRRWIASARRQGFLMGGVDRKGFEVFYLSGPVKMGGLTKCKDICLPVEMKLSELAKPGWQRYLWAAFLATLRGRPMSQATKETITGVEPRRQRLYQTPDKNGESWSYASYNYSTSNVDPSHVEKIKEITGWNYFVSGNQVRQRLPDARWIALEAFGIIGAGKRTRKLREAFELSLLSKKGLRENAGQYIQGNGGKAVFRLFHFERGKARNYLRKILNVPIDEQPLDIFVTLRRDWRVTSWEAMTSV